MTTIMAYDPSIGEEVEHTVDLFDDVVVAHSTKSGSTVAFTAGLGIIELKAALFPNRTDGNATITKDIASAKTIVDEISEGVL